MVICLCTSQFACAFPLVDHGQTVLQEDVDTHCRHDLSLLVGNDLRTHEAHEVDVLNLGSVLPVHQTFVELVALLVVLVDELDHSRLETNSLNHLSGSLREVLSVILVGYDSSFVEALFIALPKVVRRSLEACEVVSDEVVNVLGVHQFFIEVMPHQFRWPSHLHEVPQNQQPRISGSKDIDDVVGEVVLLHCKRTHHVIKIESRHPRQNIHLLRHCSNAYE